MHWNCEFAFSKLKIVKFLRTAVCTWKQGISTTILLEIYCLKNVQSCTPGRWGYVRLTRIKHQQMKKVAFSDKKGNDNDIVWTRVCVQPGEFPCFCSWKMVLQRAVHQHQLTLTQISHPLLIQVLPTLFPQRTTTNKFKASTSPTCETISGQI